MRPIHLISQLAVWAAALVAMNVAVARMARNSVPRAVARSIDGSPPITDLFLGNSLVQAGVDPQAFAAASPGRRVLNAGLGATAPPEHDILLRRALPLKPSRIHYGFVDLQLFDRPPGGWGDLVGNRAMAYYLDPETSIRFYAADDPAAAWRMRLVACVPMLVDRHALWGKVERLRRRLGEVGRVAAATNRFGRVDDFRLLEADDPASFRRRCAKAADGPGGFNAPVADMLDLARQSGARMTLVEMPMPTDHRSRFYDHAEWSRLRARTRAMAKQAGADYVDACAWIGDEGFADALHLNAGGAAEFSRKMAAIVPLGGRTEP